MPLKTPAFWYRAPDTSSGLTERLLAPAAMLYALGRAFRETRQPPPARAGIPILCVGNIVAGGGGKTPAALALHRLIKEHKIAASPFFLTRGYGGAEKGPLLLDRTRHTAADVGDEAFLLGEKGPVIVSSDRPAGAKLARESGAGMILMDDGFQNPSLHKDLSVLVIDGETGFGNGRLLPAGPLREPPQSAFRRAQAVILTGEDKRNLLAHIPGALPVFRASVMPCFTGDHSAAYIGFAGLARPEKFRRTLEQCGLKLVAFHAFADHHPYTDRELDALLAEAQQRNARLITTEKDFQRLPEEYRKRIKTLPIALSWQDETALVSFLKEKLYAFIPSA